MAKEKRTPKPWDSITKEELFKRFVISQHYIHVLEDFFSPDDKQVIEINHLLAVSLGIEPHDLEKLEPEFVESVEPESVEP